MAIKWRWSGICEKSCGESISVQCAVHNWPLCSYCLLPILPIESRALCQLQCEHIESTTVRSDRLWQKWSTFPSRLRHSIHIAEKDGDDVYFCMLWIFIFELYLVWLHCIMVCAVCPPLASRWPLLPRSTLTNIGPHYQALLQLRAKAISTIACSRHNIYQPACVTKLRLGKEQAVPEKQQLQSVQASRPDSAGNRFRCSSSSVELGQLEHTVVGHGRCPLVGCDRETACGRPCNNVEVLRGKLCCAAILSQRMEVYGR